MVGGGRPRKARLGQPYRHTSLSGTSPGELQAAASDNWLSARAVFAERQRGGGHRGKRRARRRGRRFTARMASHPEVAQTVTKTYRSRRGDTNALGMPTIWEV
jgi:hypothetical protein